MRWSDDYNLFPSLYDALQSNWGDAPSRAAFRNDVRPFGGDVSDVLPHNFESWEIEKGLVRMGWYKLTDDEKTYVDSCFAGRTLQQVLEGVTFDFVIDGVSRAFTHQNVRTRLGAGFMQHGGRDNDWRHRPWTMPETMRRACVIDAGHPEENEVVKNGLKHCISNWEPIEYYLGSLHRGCSTPWNMHTMQGDDSYHSGMWHLDEAIELHINNCRQLYAALVDAGIPWQDARRVLPIGMQTYIHDQYNYLALSGVLANRLEHIMDWEFNCVAQLMLREIKMKCPPLFSKYLGSHSDKAKSAKFAGLESWPPDGKYPNPYERCTAMIRRVPYETMIRCDRPKDDYLHNGDTEDSRAHVFQGADSLPRQHRPEQMPFFVLHPDSMTGGPIKWIPTNGTYPHEQVK